LHAFGPGTIEHLLGDVLGYWRREKKADFAPLLSKCNGEIEDLLDDPEVLAGLEYVSQFERSGSKGPEQVYCYTMPEQECSLAKGKRLIFTTAEGGIKNATIDRIDRDSHEVDLKWKKDETELGFNPSVFVYNEWRSPDPKPAAISELAAAVLEPSAGPPNPAAMALLRRDLPTFVNGFGPIDGVFTDDLDQMLAWATGLNQTVVAIQGPPGTGKTFRGARLVRKLVLAGKRVGITAMSHNAIDNLLEEVVDAFAEAGDLDRLNAFRKRKKPDSPLERVKYRDDNEAAAKDGYNLVAGTTWLFANDAMLNNPVDVLIIDEAGQLALADALAVTRSAHNLVLLGDPLQLAQVTKAAHPNDSGRSVLEHVLGDHVTMPPDRGVFLAETRRMHPDVSSFISDQIYEGRLTSHSSCAVQNTEFGTGLRWIRADHVGRSTDSEEEAEIIFKEILRLLGTTWTDRHGKQTPLTANDILVVAPYNDQVNLVRSLLEGDPRTRDVAIGTVDKYQGREAAVVFFTMTASTEDNMRRGVDFLFSRNRFNVAISRARCLAYLVCTEQLLNSRGKNIEQMRLISTICSFAERATIVSVQPVT
ncbi:MAG: ATP-binding protein, partial [Verrucomicrobiota bacterium]